MNFKAASVCLAECQSAGGRWWVIACAPLVVWLICFLSLIKLTVSQPMNFSCFCPSSSLLHPAGGGVSDWSGGLAATRASPHIGICSSFLSQWRVVVCVELGSCQIKQLRLCGVNYLMQKCQSGTWQQEIAMEHLNTVRIGFTLKI